LPARTARRPNHIRTQVLVKGEGWFVSRRRDLHSAYAASGYVNPERAWPPRIQRARREAVVFHHLAGVFADLMAPVGIADKRPRRELNALFRRCYQEGLNGKRADRASELLSGIGA
jgi:hypothetical protein